MKMTLKQARELGVDLPRRKSGRGKGLPNMAKSSREYDGKGHEDRLFGEMCQAHGLPLPVGEYEFAKEASGRLWRFDWLFEGWLALEIEGGVFTNGAHTRGKHFLSDMEKYNEAAILGYTVIRCTPEDVETGAAFALVRRALDSYLEA